MCNFTADVTAWAHLGRERWSGFGQHRGRPTTGRPYQEVDGTSAAGLAEGTETASGWAAAKPARAVLSSEAAKSQSQEGKGWAPWWRESEGQTEGAWCLGL